MPDVGTGMAGFGTSCRLQEEGTKRSASFTKAVESADPRWSGRGSCIKAARVALPRCDAEWLTARFDRLIANMDDVKARVRRHVERCQSLLASQFDCLFRPSAEIHTENEDVLMIRSVR